MTDTILRFPRSQRAVPPAAEVPRVKAAAALRSCLQHLAEEARGAALPLTAIVIDLAVRSIDRDLAGDEDATGGEDPAGGD